MIRRRLISVLYKNTQIIYFVKKLFLLIRRYIVINMSTHTIVIYVHYLDISHAYYTYLYAITNNIVVVVVSYHCLTHEQQ